MYNPEDIHGWSSTFKYNPTETIKQQRAKIEKLEAKIKQLEKEKQFLIDGIVRQSIQVGAENRK